MAKRQGAFSHQHLSTLNGWCLGGYGSL